MKHILIRKITTLSILLAICVAISYLDSLISGIIFSAIPGLKIGLANIIIILVLYQYGFKEGLVICILKSVIVGLLFSGITALIIGGTASLISFLIMALLKKMFKEKTSMISISFIGGITHIFTQLGVVSLIYKLGEVVFAYGIYLILISIVSSIIVGILSIQANKLLIKINNKGEKNE